MTRLSWIAANVRTLLWAFAFAVAVWVAAVTSADPDEARLLPESVAVEVIGQDPSLVIATEVPETVEIVLRAPRSVWAELDANPRGVRAILDLSGRAAGLHDVDLQIQVDARPVRIVSVAPPDVQLRLEPLADQSMKVELSLAGQLAAGYQAGDAKLEPDEVVVSGGESTVARVDGLRVQVSLDSVRETVDADLPVQALDAEGRVVPGVTIVPSDVHVTLPISQQGGYRDMAVKVVVRGRVASGYRLTDISVFPPVITVYSSQPEIVNLLPAFLETQPLDLNNAEDDITTRLGLNLPPGVSVVGEQTVLIQAGVSPIESSITLADEAVALVGLEDGLSAQISPTSVDVIVSGPLALLYTLTPQDVQVTVDVTGLVAGIYQKSPRVEILISDVVVESVLPGTIQVELTAATAAAPTPRP
jgi:YbbR domain-containing protein